MALRRLLVARAAGCRLHHRHDRIQRHEIENETSENDESKHQRGDTGGRGGWLRLRGVGRARLGAGERGEHADAAARRRRHPPDRFHPRLRRALRQGMASLPRLQEPQLQRQADT